MDLHSEMLRYLDIWDGISLLRVCSRMWFQRAYWIVLLSERAKLGPLACPTTLNLNSLDMRQLRHIAHRTASLQRNFSSLRPICRSFRFIETGDYLLDVVPGAQILLTFQEGRQAVVRCWDLVSGREVMHVSCTPTLRLNSTPMPSSISESGNYVLAFMITPMPLSDPDSRPKLVIFCLDHSNAESPHVDGLFTIPINVQAGSALTENMHYSIYTSKTTVTVAGNAYDGSRHFVGCTSILLTELRKGIDLDMNFWPCLVPSGSLVVTIGDHVVHDKTISFIFELASTQDRYYRQLIYFPVSLSSPPSTAAVLVPVRLFEANPCFHGLAFHIFPHNSQGLYAMVENTREETLIRSFGLAVSDDSDGKLGMVIIAPESELQPGIHVRRVASRSNYEVVVLPSSGCTSIQLLRFEPTDGTCSNHDLQIPRHRLLDDIAWHREIHNPPLSGQCVVDFRLGIVILSVKHRKTAVLSYL